MKQDKVCNGVKVSEIINLDNLYNMLLHYADGTLDFEPNCSIELLTMQLNAMSAYSAILEIRLNKEGITSYLRNPEQFLCGGGISDE